MAQQDPGQQVTETSYSDPIYDRLESVSQALSRRWPLVLLIFIIAVSGGLILQQRRNATPEAASATRFLQAQGDAGALEALLADEGETEEFRGRAAMELAQEDLLAGDSAAAVDHANKGLALVDAELHRGLSLSLRLSLASAKRELGAREEALEILRDIERKADQHPAHKIQARIMQAEILYDQAKAFDGDAAATENQQQLLEEALVILEPIQADSDPARIQLRRVASYLFYKIRFEYPQLVSEAEEPVAAEGDEPAAGVEPAAESDAAETDAEAAGANGD